MKNLFLVSIFFSVVLAINGCSKDDGTPVNAEQKLSFHIHTNVGNQTADYNGTFADANGRKFTISDFRYYLSNIVLIKGDGSEIPLADVVLLVSPLENDYLLGDVPVGDYQGLRFYYGLDSATNHLDPATFPAGNPLAVQTPGIHWDWNSGYIFSKMEGKCDTSLAGTGNANYPYFFHVGSDLLRKTVDMSNHAFSIKAGADKELVIDVNVLDVLANIDLRTENETHTMNNMPLAMKIADNFSKAFVME